MAKTIKFNLILDDYPVRNIEELQEHFSIEDMLEYFDNGLLLRWLDVRDYDKQREAVAGIDKSSDKKSILLELIKIFEIPLRDEEIDKAIGILYYLDEQRELNAIYEKDNFAKKNIIDDYHEGYNILIKHMIENRDNMAVLKADVIQMEREYYGLFKLNYYELYFQLAEAAPKAIFAVLTRDSFREYWISETANRRIYSDVKSLLDETKIKGILGNDLKIVKRDTQAMWDQIEKADVKVMVLSIASGTFVKNAGEFSEKLGSSDVNEKFLKLNGLEYQCNNQSYELRYMEV